MAGPRNIPGVAKAITEAAQPLPVFPNQSEQSPPSPEPGEPKSRSNLINELWVLEKEPSLLQLEIQRRAKEFLDPGNLLVLHQGTYSFLSDALLQMHPSRPMILSTHCLTAKGTMLAHDRL